MITVTPEIAELFEKARDSFLSRPSRDSVPASRFDIAVVQNFTDTIASMLDVASQNLARGWSLLAAGHVNDPLKEGQVALSCADRYVALAASVETGWRDLTDKGILEFDSSKLVEAREKLESEIQRYQRDWPMISPEQIESALQRYVAAARDASFDDAARAMGSSPEKRRVNYPWSVGVTSCCANIPGRGNSLSRVET